MAPKFKVTRIFGKAVYDIPAPLCREIGRITVRWAYFERYLKGIAWDFLGLDAALGRLAVRDPVPKQTLEMIRDITNQQSIAIDEAILKQLLDRVETVSSERDLFTHGIWIPTDDGWNVQRVSGKWPKQPDIPDRPYGSRRIYPEGVDVDAKKLRALWDDIEKLIGLAKKLRLSAKMPAA